NEFRARGNTGSESTPKFILAQKVRRNLFRHGCEQEHSATATNFGQGATPAAKVRQNSFWHRKYAEIYFGTAASRNTARLQRISGKGQGGTAAGQVCDDDQNTHRY
ncbi:MAG: hypothetical protein ACUVSW_15745, partial [Roseiflexus sp.]